MFVLSYVTVCDCHAGLKRRLLLLLDVLVVAFSAVVSEDTASRQSSTLHSAGSQLSLHSVSSLPASHVIDDVVLDVTSQAPAARSTSAMPRRPAASYVIDDVVLDVTSQALAARSAPAMPRRPAASHVIDDVVLDVTSQAPAARSASAMPRRPARGQC